MNSAFEIVRASREHADLILQMLREMAAYEKSAHLVEMDQSRLDEFVFSERPLAEVYLGFHDGKPVAYAMVFLCLSSYRGRPVLYLEDLFLRPEARGLGLGRRTMSFLAGLALQRGCLRLEWSVLDWNERPSVSMSGSARSASKGGCIIPVTRMR